MHPKIVFLIPYFGKLPPYFQVFLQSVANKNFDVFFFTDCSKPPVLPSNCSWHVFSFDELQKLSSGKLQFPVSLKTFRKLCDLKPALGLVFEDFIKGYDFWGSVDTDLCIGNFDKYLDKKTLDKLDVYSGIKEYVSGSFFIVRNDLYHNTIFKKSKHWQTVFLTEEYLGFDECGGQFFRELKAGKTFAEMRPPIESFTEVLFKESPVQTRLVFANNILEPKKGVTIVAKNKVTYNDHEYFLVHYIYYKAWYSFYTGKKISFPFYISRLGFFQRKPTWFNILFSKNFRVAVYKKFQINLKKLKLRA